MSNKSALVVDDSKSARFAMRKYLEGHAYAVETAENAEAAFRLLKQYRPEVIFLDHVMPGSDGFDVLQAIKADPATGDIPVVICSSSEGEGFSEQARRRGAADVLQKPPSPEQLARVLDNLRRFRAVLQPTPAPAINVPSAGIPPAVPSKVANISGADVAIERQVMKALREAMPAEPAAAALQVPVEPLRRAPVGHGLDEMADTLFAQMDELRAALNRLEARQASADLDLLNELDVRVQRLEQQLAAQQCEIRAYVDASLRTQTEQIAAITRAAREAAREEAHGVAERTVMSAASRISDQLAASILEALGRNAGGAQAPRQTP